MSEQERKSLPECIAEHIEVVIDSEEDAKRGRSRSETIHESVGNAIGTLTFVALELFGVGLWLLVNSGVFTALRTFDPFPFPLLGHIISVEAVLITAFVLMKQNRMSKLADRRAHLNLQINLLTERETTKMLGMVIEIGKRLEIHHGVFDEESVQLSRSLPIETLIEALHRKFPDG